MGRPSNTKQRKQEIVHALLKVMSEQGYEKASIQAIAEQAGLTPGLIHYHFKSKHDILIALVKWIASTAENRLHTLQSENKTSWQKLEDFINTRLAKGQGELPEMVKAWVLIAGESIRHPDVKAIYQDLIKQQLKLLRELIADAWQGKSSSSNEIIELSAIIMAAIEGAYLLSATADGVMPSGYAAEGLIGIVKARISSSF